MMLPCLMSDLFQTHTWLYRTFHQPKTGFLLLIWQMRSSAYHSMRTHSLCLPFRIKIINLCIREFHRGTGMFNSILKEHLEELTLPEGVTLLQYVDDLLLAAPTAETCLQATELLLEHVADKGYKVKREKVQCCRKTVQFLGRVMSGKGQAVSTAQRTSILEHPKPITVQHLLSFLGLTGYSRTHVPEYCLKVDPLRGMLREAGNRNLCQTHLDH